MKLTESVPEFQPLDSILLKDKFNEYVLSSYFEQQFYIPLSDKNEFRLFTNEQFLFKDDLFHKFHKSYKNSKYIFDYIEDNVEVSKEEYYFLGKKINKKEIGLKGIDSIKTNMSITYPTKIEKIVVKPYEHKKINFKNHIIEIEKSELELEIPIAISKDLQGIQGINKSNIRMNASTSSSYPLIEVHQKIKNEIEDLSRILNNVLVAKDKKQIIDLLNQLNQNHFNAKNMLVDFKKTADKLNKGIKEKEDFNEIENYESLVNAGSKVITLENQSIIFDFPDEVKSIEIYLAKENNVISKNETLYSKDKKFNKYNIYGQDGEKHERDLYGVVNKNGEIVIKAKYPQLEFIENEYFDIDYETYRINKDENKLEKLVDYEYQVSIKPGYDVLRQKSGNEFTGILKNFETEVFPFKYKYFGVYPSFIQTVLDSGQLDFYTHDFKKINFNSSDLEFVIELKHLSSEIQYPELYISKDKHEMFRLLNNKLQYLTTKPYKNIQAFDGVANYYIVSLVVDEKTQDVRYGLIDVNGKEVTPVSFYSINEKMTDDGEIKFMEKDKKEQKMKFDKFLKKYKL